jgi:hypothetical protein
VSEHRRLSVYELSQTPEFGRLSKRQAEWLLIYLNDFIEGRGFDPENATRRVYSCQTPENVRTMGAHLVSNPKIVDCVRKFFGETLEQTFTRALLKAINSPSLTVAQKDTLELFAKVHGWTEGFPSVVEAKAALPKPPGKRERNRIAKAQREAADREARDQQKAENWGFGFGS